MYVKPWKEGLVLSGGQKREDPVNLGWAGSDLVTWSHQVTTEPFDGTKLQALPLKINQLSGFVRFCPVLQGFASLPGQEFCKVSSRGFISLVRQAYRVPSSRAVAPNRARNQPSFHRNSKKKFLLMQPFSMPAHQ